MLLVWTKLACRRLTRQHRFPEIVVERPTTVTFAEHARITGHALKNWAIAQLQDSIAVALLWWVGLTILKVPWAPFWAILAAFLQIVPHIGPVLSLLGPALAAGIHWGSAVHSLYVLILYAGIVIVD